MIVWILVATLGYHDPVKHVMNVREEVIYYQNEDSCKVAMNDLQRAAMTRQEGWQYGCVPAVKTGG